MNVLANAAKENMTDAKIRLRVFISPLRLKSYASYTSRLSRTINHPRLWAKIILHIPFKIAVKRCRIEIIKKWNRGNASLFIALYFKIAVYFPVISFLKIAFFIVKIFEFNAKNIVVTLTCFEVCLIFFEYNCLYQYP
mgnify:CR=1 FL=1